MEYSDEKFVDSIIKSLQSISDNISGDKEWTQAIKMKLIEVSEQFGFHSNCSLAQALNNLTCKYQLYDPAEWMYDVIVYTIIDPQKLNYSAKEMRNELKPNLKLAENTFPKILKLLKKACYTGSRCKGAGVFGYGGSGVKQTKTLCFPALALCTVRCPVRLLRHEPDVLERGVAS